MKKNSLFPAFTLVELLVTITIISTLATIGIISYIGYNSSARDGKKIYDINQILSSLNQYTLGKSLDIPEEHIAYSSSGVVFAIQGQLSDAYLKKINFFGAVYDERLEVFPSLLYSLQQQDFQILTYFEKQHLDYTAVESLAHGQFPGVFGKRLGILMDTESGLPLEKRSGISAPIDTAGVQSPSVRSFLTHEAFLDTQDISFLPDLAANGGKGWKLEAGQFICEGELCDGN